MSDIALNASSGEDAGIDRCSSNWVSEGTKWLERGSVVVCAEGRFRLTGRLGGEGGDWPLWGRDGGDAGSGTLAGILLWSVAGVTPELVVLSSMLALVAQVWCSC